MEACAALLRMTDSAALSLTDVALRCGFASSTHFSVLFRQTFGASPSTYGRRNLKI